MINLHCKNTKIQGDIGLGLAIGWFVSQGYTVSIPLTDSQEYDLVVENGKLSRVQIKTTRFKPGNYYQVGLRTLGGNRSGTGKTKLFSDNSCDILFVVTEEGSYYCIPRAVIHATTTINLGSKWEEYKVN